jgi:hypothetical protein
VRGRLTGIWATRRSGVRHVPVGRRDRSSPQEASHPHVADIHVTKDAAAGVRQTRILASRRVPDRRVSQPWDELVPPVLRRSVVDENVDTTSTAISRGGGNWTARPTAGPPAHQRNTRSPVSTGRAWHIVECPRTTPDVPRRGVIERRLDGARRSGVGRISVPVEVGILDDGWDVKMHVARRDIGTGMTATEVRELSQRIDIDALLEYRLTVGRRTKELVGQIDDPSLDEPVTADNVDVLRALETFGEHAGWIGDYWQTKTRAWLLWLPTGHCYQHLGEAITVRTMIGVPWAP